MVEKGFEIYEEVQSAASNKLPIFY
jgi:hypothetical protein